MIEHSELWFIDIRKYIYDRLTSYVNLIQKIWWPENIICRDLQTIKGTDRPFISYSHVWWSTNSLWIRKDSFQIDIWATNMEEFEDLKDLVVWLFNRSKDDWVKSQLSSVWPDMSNPEKSLFRKPLTFRFVFKDQKF